MKKDYQAYWPAAAAVDHCWQLPVSYFA